MSYSYSEHVSPNHSQYTGPRPYNLVVIHWWGHPRGQTFDSIINWFMNPASEVSANVVIEHHRVALMLPHFTASWANGNYNYNIASLTIELNPNDVEGSIETCVEYLSDLIKQGILSRSFRIMGHRDIVPTSCPGDFYPRLSEIKAKALGTYGTSTSSVDKPVFGAFPLPPGHYFGDISGPEVSHGGFYVNEQVYVKKIQQMLIFKGYVPGVTDIHSPWADGIWESPTTEAVRRWFSREYPGQPHTDRIYADDWAILGR